MSKVLKMNTVNRIFNYYANNRVNINIKGEQIYQGLEMIEKEINVISPTELQFKRIIAYFTKIY